MTRPKHHIDASWPAESCPRQPHASWLVGRLALIHSTSSWSSNPHNAPSPTEPYAPSSFTHFGRNLYEAPAETLVGSSIDASRNGKELRAFSHGFSHELVPSPNFFP